MADRQTELKKNLRIGRELEAPMAKAMKSVTEVMVIATPAWCMAALTRPSRLCPASWGRQTNLWVINITQGLVHSN